MKILLAPNAFKESMTAREAAEAMRRGFARALPAAEFVLLPVADGGDGTAETLMDRLGGREIHRDATGPLGEPVRASMLRLGPKERGVFLIEMAKASGLALVPPDRRDPMKTTSRGLGEMIVHARKLGAKRVILAVGGSATVDGGAGMMEALGYRMLDKAGRGVPPGGAGLERLAKIEPPRGRRTADLRVSVICDVENPLLGERGAAAVFGPQKGATPAMIPRLEAGLANLAARMAEDLGADHRELLALPGGGAAGGVPVAVKAALGGELRRGAELILEMLDFRSALRGTSLVVTGEGQLDYQTLDGKAPAAAGRAAAAAGIPCLALAGRVDPGLATSEEAMASGGWTVCGSIMPGPAGLPEAIARGAGWLETAAFQWGRALALGAALRTQGRRR